MEITSNLEISSSENFSVSLVDPTGLCVWDGCLAEAAVAVLAAKGIAMATTYFAGKAALDVTHAAGGMTQNQHAEAMSEFKGGMNRIFSTNEPQLKLAEVFTGSVGTLHSVINATMAKDLLSFRFNEREQFGFASINRIEGMKGLILSGSEASFNLMGKFSGGDTGLGLSQAAQSLGYINKSIGIIEWTGNTFFSGSYEFGKQ